MDKNAEEMNKVGKIVEEAPRRKQWKMPQLTKILYEETTGKRSVSMEYFPTTGPS
jgi:hypothetical protein